MNKFSAPALAMLAIAVAVAAPILFAIFLARQQGLDAETVRVLAYARDVLTRADSTTNQIANGIKALEAGDTNGACAPTSIALMQQIDIASSDIQAMGYMVGNTLVCSSFGPPADGMDLGPPDVVTKNGVANRYNVKFPFAPDITFLVDTLNGYTAIIDKNAPINVTTDVSGVALGVFTVDNGDFATSSGPIQREWTAALGEANEKVFIQGGYVIAIQRSQTYRIAALAAVPITYLDQRVQRTAVVLVPIGVVAGGLLALVVLRLARTQMALPAALRHAVRRREFFLVYQPIVDLQTGAWVGAEALIRWRRAGGEMIRPDLFIPVAEETGLIQLITAQVIELATRDAAELFKENPRLLLAVNLSTDDLTSNDTVALVRRLIAESGADPHNLVVEATERGFMQPVLAREVIAGIRAQGVRVAIDDFGTGYSSLSYLENFEVDLLKIDKAFVDTLGLAAATSRVALHIIHMAKSLNLQLVAEGVETAAQARLLHDRGVEYAQGWLFSKPLSPAELLLALRQPHTLDFLAETDALDPSGTAHLPAAPG